MMRYTGVEESIFFIRQEYIKRFFPERWEEARNMNYDELKKLVDEVRGIVDGAQDE